jgi:hypothetical protein
MLRRLSRRAPSMREASPDTRDNLSAGPDQSNATTARRSSTRHSNVDSRKDAEDVLRKGIAITNALNRSSDVYRVEGLTSHSAEIVENSSPAVMTKSLRIVQLNVKKQGTILYLCTYFDLPSRDV